MTVRDAERRQHHRLPLLAPCGGSGTGRRRRGGRRLCPERGAPSPCRPESQRRRPSPAPGSRLRRRVPEAQRLSHRRHRAAGPSRLAAGTGHRALGWLRAYGGAGPHRSRHRLAIVWLVADTGFAAPHTGPCGCPACRPPFPGLIAFFGIPLAYVWPAPSRRRVVGAAVQLPRRSPSIRGLLLISSRSVQHPGAVFGQRLTDSVVGVVLAQTFVAALPDHRRPLITRRGRSGFHEVAATLGHPPLARFFRVGLPLAAGGIGPVWGSRGCGLRRVRRPVLWPITRPPCPSPSTRVSAPGSPTPRPTAWRGGCGGRDHAG